VPRRTPLGLLVALLATSCSGSEPPGAVELSPVPSLSLRVVDVCHDVSTRLPGSLADGVERRRTAPDEGTTAAWGDPPITFRCGTGPGRALDDLYEFDGVQWAMHDTGASRTWTTRGRAVEVQVVIPDHYDGQAELLGSLAAALRPTAR
jgi:hypothetical protein